MSHHKGFALGNGLPMPQQSKNKEILTLLPSICVTDAWSTHSCQQLHTRIIVYITRIHFVYIKAAEIRQMLSSFAPCFQCQRRYPWHPDNTRGGNCFLIWNYFGDIFHCCWGCTPVAGPDGPTVSLDLLQRHFTADFL